MSVRREIERRTGREVSIGAVYATLDRLEQKGYIESHDGEATAERGGRAKRHFRLRAAGVRGLWAARRQLERMWEGLDLPKPEKI